MKQIIYTIYRPQIYITKTKNFGHFVYKNKKKTIIAPLEFHKDSINPKNFLKLKTTIKIKKILIHDRTNPCFKKTLIVLDNLALLKIIVSCGSHSNHELWSTYISVKISDFALL